MGELLLVAFVVVAGIGAVYLVYRALLGGSVRGAFKGLSVTQVADIPGPGRFRLAGRVVTIGEPPVSETSGRAYVARDLRIVEGGTGDSASTRPAKQVCDFLLDDGTGRALVRGGGGGGEDAIVAISRDFEAPKTTLDQLPWVDELLRAGGYHNGSPSTCTIRLYEGVLAPGAFAGVVGWIEPADDEAGRLGATHVVRAEAGKPVAIRPERPGRDD